MAVTTVHKKRDTAGCLPLPFPQTPYEVLWAIRAQWKMFLQTLEEQQANETNVANPRRVQRMTGGNTTTDCHGNAQQRLITTRSTSAINTTPNSQPIFIPRHGELAYLHPVDHFPPSKKGQLHSSHRVVPYPHKVPPKCSLQAKQGTRAGKVMSGWSYLTSFSKLQPSRCLLAVTNGNPVGLAPASGEDCCLLVARTLREISEYNKFFRVVRSSFRLLPPLGQDRGEASNRRVGTLLYDEGKH